MGKRKKASKPPPKKKRGPLASTFQCLFCNHENSVSVKMEKKAGVGNLSCKICGQSYQAPINYLSAAVDVYADWIDACEDAQKDAAASGAAPSGIEPHPSYRMGASQRRKEREVEDDGGPDVEAEVGGLGYEEDGFVVEDDDAAEAEYGDED